MFKPDAALSAVQILTIPEDLDDQRVDNFLIRELKGVPRSRIYRLLRKGEIRVNKKRIRPEYRLKSGDLLRLPPIRRSVRESIATLNSDTSSFLERAILYESDQLMVLNKPEGWAVHGGSGVNLGLIEALRLLRPDCHQLELVHRLDRDTSGCLLVAKRRSLLKFLHAQLRDAAVDKRYLALVKGHWPKRIAEVTAPLERNTLASGERIVRVSEAGKASRTCFEVQAANKLASLLVVKPQTGRTHQIRVHTQWVGHPIAGDPKYGDPAFDAQISEQGLARLCLHAASIRVRLAPDTKPMTFTAPLASEFQATLDKLFTP